MVVSTSNKEDDHETSARDRRRSERNQRADLDRKKRERKIGFGEGSRKEEVKYIPPQSKGRLWAVPIGWDTKVEGGAKGSEKVLGSSRASQQSGSTLSTGLGSIEVHRFRWCGWKRVNCTGVGIWHTSG